MEWQADGNLAMTLKRKWSDGTTGIILSPIEFVERRRGMGVREPDGVDVCLGWENGWILEGDWGVEGSWALTGMEGVG